MARDYASISRAHCNDESSAWSNPHFSHPLGQPPLGGVFGHESAPPKGAIQRESMDLSPTQPAVPVALMSHSPAGALARLLNGDTGAEHDLKQRLYPSSSPLVDPKPEAPANASTTPLPNRMAELPGFAALRTPGDAGRPPPTMPSAPDNVEFALESLFHSDTSLTVTPPAQNPRTLCVESVEKILKSPSPDSDDELTILYDSHSDKITVPGRDVDAKPEKPLAKAADKTTKVLILKKKNCDCAPKTSNSTSTAKATKPPAKCERLNDVKPSETAKKTNCDAKNGDRNEASTNPTQDPKDNLTLKTESSNVRSEEKPVEKNTRSKAIANSTSKTEPDEEKPIANARSGADTAVKTEPTSEPKEKITRSRAADQPVKTEPSNDEKSTDASKAASKESANNEEITYVQVENELEKMFAGIEDSTANGSDKDPLAAAKCDSNNLSTMSTPHSRNSANLFDGVKAAKASKKKASKKSKPAGSKMKEKQKSSSSFKETTSSSLEARRVPVIHIEGSKENPISAHIINSIKSEEDDVSDGRTSAKRKLGKSDRGLCYFWSPRCNE